MEFDNGSLMVGRWNGTPIRIHWSVLLCAFFFGGFEFLPLYWISFFIVVLAHEAGHAMVIRHFRLWVDEIVIHGIGGYCRWSGNAGLMSRTLIAWGGVAAQSTLLLIAYAFYCVFSAPCNAITRQVFHAFVISNLWMIFFNLWPIEPLDGAEAWKIVGLLRNHWSTRMSERKRRKQNETLKRQLQEIMSQHIDGE